jgi:hypothetical protein
LAFAPSLCGLKLYIPFRVLGDQCGTNIWTTDIRGAGSLLQVSFLPPFEGSLFFGFGELAAHSAGESPLWHFCRLAQQSLSL